MDDTYTIFKTEAECDTFLKRLNGLHTALDFSLVYTVNPHFRGYTLDGVRFAQNKRKISLIKTLTHRALMICSKSKLDSELEKLKSGPKNWAYGNSSLRFESQIKQAITNCFFAVNPRVVYSTKKRPLPPFKRTAFLPHKKVLLYMNLRVSVILAT